MHNNAFYLIISSSNNYTWFNTANEIHKLLKYKERIDLLYVA